MRHDPADTIDPSENETDAALLARLRRGETRALEKLLARYWAPLLAYGTRLVRDPDAAADIAQETFVRLWERRARWAREGSVAALLYRITRNLALDARKRAQRRIRRERASPRRDAPTPAQYVEGSELDVAVNAAIAALPSRRREVFVLARFHELSHREIARVMGVSEQTVANHLRLALADLRVVLAPYLETQHPKRSRTQPDRP